MDPQKHDRLKFFGLPLVGGSDTGGFGLSLGGLGAVGTVAGLAQLFKSPVDTIYIDQFLPFMSYKFEKQTQDGSYDLLVGNVLVAFLDATEAILGTNSGLSGKLKEFFGVQRVKDFIPAKDNGLFAVTYFGTDQSKLAGLGKLGMVFKKANPIITILARLPETAINLALMGGGPLVDLAATGAAAATRWAKAMIWSTAADPLVLDLSGQGLVTTSLGQSSVYFDLNNDFFSERTGWLAGGAGFLVLDKNGNGAVDDGSEMFGSSPGASPISRNTTATRTARSTRTTRSGRCCRSGSDANSDGVSQAGELHGLGELGIVSIMALNGFRSDGRRRGTSLRAVSSFTRADGTTGAMFEAIFPTDLTDTIYHGESGRELASVQTSTPRASGGSPTWRAIANDFDLADLVKTRAAAMTTPNCRTLVAQAGDILGAWGYSDNQTRELTPVLVSADGTRAARPRDLCRGRIRRLLDAQIRARRSRRGWQHDRAPDAGAGAGAGDRGRRALAAGAGVVADIARRRRSVPAGRALPCAGRRWPGGGPRPRHSERRWQLAPGERQSRHRLPTAMSSRTRPSMTSSRCPIRQDRNGVSRRSGSIPTPIFPVATDRRRFRQRYRWSITPFRSPTATARSMSGRAISTARSRSRPSSGMRATSTCAISRSISPQSSSRSTQPTTAGIASSC